MSQFPYSTGRQQPLEYGTDAGSSTLSRFFNAVYAWMAAGLATTAVVAWYASTQQDLLRSVLSGPGMLILFIAEIGLVVAISRAVNRISATAATALFLVYSALNGLMLSAIFLVYAHATIASAFIVTAGSFAAISVYGFVTKADLTRLGTFLFMALIGLILASVVNIFLHSTGLMWLITYAGVLIFVGLTAYDTQKLKMIAYQTEGNAEMAARMSIVGALVLYLDFINLFLLILRIMGDRRN